MKRARTEATEVPINSGKTVQRTRKGRAEGGGEYSRHDKKKKRNKTYSSDLGGTHKN